MAARQQLPSTSGVAATGQVWPGQAKTTPSMARNSRTPHRCVSAFRAKTRSSPWQCRENSVIIIKKKWGRSSFERAAIPFANTNKHTKCGRLFIGPKE